MIKGVSTFYIFTLGFTMVHVDPDALQYLAEINLVFEKSGF